MAAPERLSQTTQHPTRPLAFALALLIPAAALPTTACGSSHTNCVAGDAGTLEAQLTVHESDDFPQRLPPLDEGEACVGVAESVPDTDAGPADSLRLYTRMTVRASQDAGASTPTDAARPSRDAAPSPTDAGTPPPAYVQLTTVTSLPPAVANNPCAAAGRQYDVDASTHLSPPPPDTQPFAIAPARLHINAARQDGSGVSLRGQLQIDGNPLTIADTPWPITIRFTAPPCDD